MTPRTPSKNIFLRWALLLSVLLAGAILQYVVFERVKGKRELAAWKEEMRAKGEKFTLEELKISKIPKEDNGTTDLLSAASELKLLNNTSPLIDYGAFPLARFTAPGHVMSFLDLDDLKKCFDPSSHQDLYRKTSPTWQELEKEIVLGSKILKKANEALKRSYLGVELDYKKGVYLLMPHISNVGNLRSWLSASASYHLHQGDLDKVLEDIESITLLSRFLKDDRLLISQLVRIANGSVGLNVTWQALQAPGWSDAQLQKLQQIWQSADLDLLGDSPKTFEAERIIYGVWAFEELRHSNKGLNAFLNPWTGSSTASSSSYEEFFREWLDTLYATCWRTIWADQDELRYLQILQKHLEATRKMIVNKSWSKGQPLLKEADTLATPTNAYDRLKHPFSGSIVPAMHHAILKCIKYEIQREMTVAAIALKRYRLKFGKYPASLQELVPNYLSDLPIDYIDGKPLRYLLNPDGTFTLYSIGEDGVDDHGNSTSKSISYSYNPPCGFFEGLDIVWPSRATIEEIGRMKE